MAIRYGPTRVTFKPAGETTAGKTRASTLQRWLERQKKATQLYARAEEPLAETAGMFRPGGGYGAGQTALIEDEAKRVKAEALAEQVATGMSSGSLATSTRLRSAADVTKAKLGVEDVRTQFLAQALGKLGGLRGTQAGQVGATVDPTYAPYMGYLGGLEQRQTGLQTSVLQSNLARQLATRPKPAQPKKEEEPPWASMVW